MTSSKVLLSEVYSWIAINQSGLMWSGLVILIYLLTTRKIFPAIDKSVDEGGFKDGALKKAYHTVRLLSGTVAAAILLIVWGVDISGLLLISTSILTLTGVALFANWSLLSNVTAYFVLLSHSAYKRGNFIRVIEADNYIEGYISDIGIFNTKLVTDEREFIIYPNNLLLTRPTLINPRVHLDVIGKIDSSVKLGIENDVKS